MTEASPIESTADEHVILDADLLAHPHEFYKMLREQRPVARVIVPSGIRAWLVTRHRDVRAALADPRLAKNSVSVVHLMRRHTDPDKFHNVVKSAAHHMLNSDPPDHTRLRRLVNRAFTPRGIAQYRPRIEQIADELLDAVAAEVTHTGGEIDLLDSFAFPLPIAVISELLGVPLDQRDEFREWSNGILSGRPSPTRRYEDLAAYLLDLIRDKRRHPGPDVLSMIVAAEGADALSDQEALDMVLLLLIAGHETTVNLIGNGVLALLRHPEQLAALRADPTRTPQAVEELLRYDGPFNMATLRYTTEPVVFSGTTIPAGEFVLVALTSANRDADQHPDPDRLDIRREGANLAFGHGIHYCLGAPLARLEGEIALNALLARFPRLGLAREPEELGWRSGTLVRGLVELPVRIGP
ncbi:cytochrome P450 family protein [Micromonospora sp. CA-240977]|uniref:cytochrome P450 family protein n=1 Tax=Micromonospora sp. CA-240977 TaxID=3239957 RepID=UPI003D923152